MCQQLWLSINEGAGLLVDPDCSDPSRSGDNKARGHCKLWLKQVTTKVTRYLLSLSVGRLRRSQDFLQDSKRLPVRTPSTMGLPEAS